MKLRGRVALFLLCAGCGSTQALAYAQRVPGERAPKPVAAVALVEMGKPKCDYEVIGAVWGNSLDDLRETAATHGGDGVYDTSCDVSQHVGLLLLAQVGRCDGRVYVCKGGGRTP